MYPESVTITAVKGDDTLVTHYVASMHDISARKTAEELIHNLAFFDPLTQLPNRRLLECVREADTVEELIKQADLTMYQVKATGRNALRFFDPTRQATGTDPQSSLNAADAPTKP